LSILKDLFFINRALDFDPDLILWFITLESLNRGEQVSTPLVANNAKELNEVIKKYGLEFEPVSRNIWDRFLFRQRRNYADLLRLQIYGVMWAATGIDQELPETYSPAQRDFELDDSYKNLTNSDISEDDLALSVIMSTIDKISTTDFILINEPILISKGKNSHVRYNYYYPRWAYDQFREIINSFVKTNNIKYYDFWNLVPENNFTNSAIHLDITGEQMLAQNIYKVLKNYCEE
jgi:hypothetical protein